MKCSQAEYSACVRGFVPPLPRQDCRTNSTQCRGSSLRACQSIKGLQLCGPFSFFHLARHVPRAHNLLVTTFCRWRFTIHHQSRGRTWLWQRFAADGRLEKTSEPHPSYGKAVLDAMNHGFKPKDDASSVDLTHGVMHFPPGRQPYYDDGSHREVGKETRKRSRNKNEVPQPDKSRD